MRFVQYIARFFTRDDSVVNVALEWSRALAALGHEVVLAHGTTDVWRTDLDPGISEEYVLHAGAGKNLVSLTNSTVQISVRKVSKSQQTPVTLNSAVPSRIMSSSRRTGPFPRT